MPLLTSETEGGKVSPLIPDSGAKIHLDVWDSDNPGYVKRLLNQGGENVYIFKIANPLPLGFKIGVHAFDGGEVFNEYNIDFSTGKKIGPLGIDYYTRLSVAPEDIITLTITGDDCRFSLNDLDLGRAFRAPELASEKCQVFISDTSIVSLREGTSRGAASFESPLKYARTAGGECATIDLSGAKNTDQIEEITPLENEVIELVSPMVEKKGEKKSDENNFEIKTLSESSQTYEELKEKEDDFGFQRASSGIIKTSAEAPTNEGGDIGDRRKSL